MFSKFTVQEYIYVVYLVMPKWKLTYFCLFDQTDWPEKGKSKCKAMHIEFIWFFYVDSNTGDEISNLNAW